MLQKYHFNESKPQPNGTVELTNTVFRFGPILVGIRNCPTPFGPRTVYVQGEADTAFSIPAACEFRRRVIRGYLTVKDGEYQFHVYRDGPTTIYPSCDTEDLEFVAKRKALELQKLMRKARRLANERGHKLRPFLQSISNKDVYASDCKHCGALISINPKATGAQVSLHSLADYCPKH